MRNFLIKIKNRVKYAIQPVIELLGEMAMFLLSLSLMTGMMIGSLSIDACALSYIWDAVVPLVFPEAVKYGFIAKTMDFSTMFWICLGVFILKPANLKAFRKHKGDANE